MKHSSELLHWQVSLTKNIVILEEFGESDSVFLNNVFDLLHQVVVSLLSIEVSKSVNISGLCVCCGSMDNILKAVSIIQEFSVLDVIIFVAVNKSNSVNIILTDLEMKRVEHLAEDFRGDLEVAKSITVLEEAGSIESVSSDFFTESLNDFLYTCSFSLGSLTSSIDSCSSCSANSRIAVLLKTLESEDLVDFIGEFLPLDMLALLRSLKDLAEQLKFFLGDRGLGHGETNSELLGSDKARSESIEVTEELVDSNTLLLALLCDASDHIIHIIRGVSHDFGVACAGLGLGVVIGAVIETLTDSK